MAIGFVERRFELKDGSEVVVRFFQPVRRDDDYRCDYKIIWPDRERTFWGAGIDGIQALLHAMMNAHADLLVSPESKSGALLWLGDRKLGLPLAGSLTPEDFV